MTLRDDTPRSTDDEYIDDLIDRLNRTEALLDGRGDYTFCTSAVCDAIETIAALRAELAEVRSYADRIGLAYIQASNPGIDMEEVKRVRGELA